jgi:hypothetical protein
MAYTSIADVLYQWESIGVFEFLLPFLLIFAIVFGILSSTRFIGDNKGVYVIISFAIGLLSLRWRGYVSTFMTELFPRLGIGLAVLLAVMILVGLFIAEDETRYWGWGLAAIGFIIAIMVVYQTFDVLGFTWGYGNDMFGLVILAILLIGVIIAVAAGGKGHKGGGGYTRSGPYGKTRWIGMPESSS